MRHKYIALISVILFHSHFLNAQDIAVKSNVLYDATTTFNLWMEVALSRQVFLELSGNYNPWNFSQLRKIKHWMMQSEIRYW